MQFHNDIDQYLQTSVSQPSEVMGPRLRKLTEKGHVEKVNRLKRQRISALSAVTRKRNEISSLMADINNLHVVKLEIGCMENLFQQYRNACEYHHKELNEDEDKQAVLYHNEEKEKQIMVYLSQVSSWIVQAEHNLSEHLDMHSSKGSNHPRTSRTSSRSSRFSARKKERVKLAELLAERSMFKKKQALRDAEEDLNLEIEIIKTEAREKVLAEMSDDEPVGLLPKVPESFSTSASFRPLPTTSLPVQSLSSAAQITNQPDVTSFNAVDRGRPDDDQTSRRRTDETSNLMLHEKLFPLNGRAPEFHPRKPAKPISTSNINSGLKTTNEIYDDESTLTTQLTEHALNSIISLQQRQTETVISTHQQLTAAMTLPQPSIPKFRGDPMEYKIFVMSFDARIQHRVTNSADRLYYLNQHMDGEPKDLIEGCLHMNSDEGYIEARKLLNKEYGDPYKISMAYVQKILNWTPIKFDEGKVLKSLSIFLIKCKIAMKSISHMSVLNHAPNMQAVVSKLPFHLQAKWRDQAAKTR